MTRPDEATPSVFRRHWSRRDAIFSLSALGLGGVALTAARGAIADEGTALDSEAIAQAEWITGLRFTPEERELMLNGVGEVHEYLAALRETPLDNSVPYALSFSPLERAAEVFAPRRNAVPIEVRGESRPRDEELCFLPVTALAALVRNREITSEALTRLYLERIERYDPTLRCVISRTDDSALDAARLADREIAAGRYRGPLHGIPWGAKDLIAVPGYPTTWGAEPFRDQVRDEKATIIERLEEAGAVLVAKLSVGALAWGDVWFDATTRNPWNVEEGSSGSSAGSASATAAGLVGFAIGTETWGSIVSPCTRCGATGLRPTFGRIPRYGVMALSWTMDKLGPIARSVEDCALVLDAVHGSDSRDRMAVDRPFAWPPPGDARALRVGFVPELFEEDRGATVASDAGTPEEVEAMRQALREWGDHDRETLAVLGELGFELVPVKLPPDPRVNALQIILLAEAASAFDDLTRSGRDELLLRQEEHAWPNVFRYSQLISAVEYVRANRIRHLVMEETEATLEGIDALVAPTFGGDHLLLTNLTGHPSVVVPNGFRSSNSTPTSITFTGRLHGETALLAVAKMYQDATDHHLAHPPL